MKSEADLYDRSGRLAQALLEASIDGETRMKPMDRAVGRRSWTMKSGNVAASN